MNEKEIFVEMPVHLGVPGEGDDCAGAEAIARSFGVKRDTVMNWKAQGAPIFLVGNKCQANYRELWDWIKEHSC